PELAPTPTAQPEPAMGFVGKALSRLVFEPLPMPDSPIPHPDMKDRVAYGKYLMTDAMECANCHSASFETYDIVNPEQSEGFLGGGNVVELHGLGKLLSPNITMHPEKGIGKMTVEDFIQIVKYRQHPSGREINPIMPNYNSYSEDDIRAVWEYIQTVPVSDNDVSALTEKLAAN
nr:cytochrome c [Saprospiraceae bacterium]